MKMVIITAAFLLICVGVTGCLETAARIADLEAREYMRFCNANPTHLRCQHAEKV